MKAIVVRKGNGKYAPRIQQGDDDTVGVWLSEPYEYDNIDGAIKAIQEYKERRNRILMENQTRVVFELDL